VNGSLEFRDPERARRLLDALAHLTRDREKEPISVMHVCGSHEQAVARFGLSAALPPGLDLIMGPGCPVCVTDCPEIDEAVVGMQAGEERHVALRFADDHRMESLRGKGGTADVKLIEVKEKILPEFDDDFAKAVGGDFETMEAVRTEVRKQLEARREAEDRRGLEDKVVAAVLARHEFSVPDAMVMRHVAHQVEHARERMRRQGVDPDKLPWDYGKLIPELKPASEQAVKRALLLEAIAEQEAINPAEDEVDIEIERFAQAAQRPVPAVRRMMEKSGDLESLRGGLREKKTLDFLVQHAKVSA